jgi:hypothetical protein
MTALTNAAHDLDDGYRDDTITEMRDLIGAYDSQINDLLQKVKETPAEVTHADVIRIPHLMQQRQSTFERMSNLTSADEQASAA